MSNNFWNNVPTWFKSKEMWVISNLRSRLGATWNSGNYETDEDQLAKMQAFFKEINSLGKIEGGRIVADHGNFASLEAAKKAFVVNLRKRYKWAKLSKEY